MVPSPAGGRGEQPLRLGSNLGGSVPWAIQRNLVSTFPDGVVDVRADQRLATRFMHGHMQQQRGSSTCGRGGEPSWSESELNQRPRRAAPPLAGLRPPAAQPRSRRASSRRAGASRSPAARAAPADSGRPRGLEAERLRNSGEGSRPRAPPRNLAGSPTAPTREPNQRRRSAESPPPGSPPPVRRAGEDADGGVRVLAREAEVGARPDGAAQHAPGVRRPRALEILSRGTPPVRHA